MCYSKKSLWNIPKNILNRVLTFPPLRRWDATLNFLSSAWLHDLSPLGCASSIRAVDTGTGRNAELTFNSIKAFLNYSTLDHRYHRGIATTSCRLMARTVFFIVKELSWNRICGIRFFLLILALCCVYYFIEGEVGGSSLLCFLCFSI